MSLVENTAWTEAQARARDYLRAEADAAGYHFKIVFEPRNGGAQVQISETGGGWEKLGIAQDGWVGSVSMSSSGGSKPFQNFMHRVLRDVKKRKNVSPHLPADPGGGRLPPLRRVNMKKKLTGPAVGPDGRGHLHEYECNPRQSPFYHSKDAVKFFKKHAGYAQRPGETVAQAKQRSAVDLAVAEHYGQTRGWTVHWEHDQEQPDFDDEETMQGIRDGSIEYLVAVLRDEDGSVLASLGGIAIGVDDRSYGRVVEAELALEAMPNKNPAIGFTPKGAKMEREVAASGKAHAPAAVVYAAAKRGVKGLVTKKFAREHGYPTPNAFGDLPPGPGKRRLKGPDEDDVYEYGPATIEISGPAGGRWYATVRFKNQEKDIDAKSRQEALNAAMWWVDSAPELSRSNPFMVPEYAQGTAWYVETHGGEGTIVLSDLVETSKYGYAVDEIIEAADNHGLTRQLSPYVEGEIKEFSVVKGWFAHLTAHGYMDQTEWAGPFKTQREAEKYIEDTYEVDPETGEELE